MACPRPSPARQIAAPPPCPPAPFAQQRQGRPANRYAAARPAQWPAAKSALGKLLAITAPPEMQGLLTAMPDPQQQQLVDTFVAGMVAESCPPRAARWWTGCRACWPLPRAPLKRLALPLGSVRAAVLPALERS
jgi:hypothetical protein